METVVITAEKADYGVGPADRVTFVDSKYLIDQERCLHIVAESGGNIGSFNADEWRSVIRGTLGRDVESGVVEVSK